jgi:hypothetical protein
MRDEPVEFIERWAKSSVDADLQVLVDTGSPPDRIECARDLGVTVHQIAVRPWRFDVARNAALALIPEDIDLVVKVDVDEMLVGDWRDVIENAPHAMRYSYTYVWNFDAEGRADVQFMADHTISRFGWQWRHPVHEALYWTGDGPAPPTTPLPFVIAHLADPDKPRSQYLPLLAQAVAEDPADDRMAHYYARELFFRGDWVAARQEFVRHLSLPSAVWEAERAQSYRYLAKMDDYPERWLLKAAAEAPGRREPWVDLAEHWLEREQPGLAAGYAARALMISGRGADYMSEGRAWDDERLRAIAEG